MGSAPCCLFLLLPPHPTWLTSQPTVWKPQSGQPGCSQTPWDTAYRKVERSLCCARDTDSLPPPAPGRPLPVAAASPGVPPTHGAGDRVLPGVVAHAGPCISPHPPQKGGSSCIQTHRRPAARAGSWLWAPGAGCLDDSLSTWAHRSGCPVAGMGAGTPRRQWEEVGLGSRSQSSKRRPSSQGSAPHRRSGWEPVGDLWALCGHHQWESHQFTFLSVSG